VTGLRARGGFQIDISWRDGRLEAGVVRATLDGVCRIAGALTVREGGRGISAKINAGATEFEARAGRTYTASET
jgi:alpha-L-fucosidase 2